VSLLAELLPMSTEWLYLAAAVLFIVGIRDLSSAETARRGNLLAACGMILAIIGTMQHGLIVQWGWIAVGMVAGGVIGLMMAVFMPMTAMPERIAIVNGLGGAASGLVGICEVIRHVIMRPEGSTAPEFSAFHMGVAGLEIMLGALTFTGSMVAFGKLKGLISSKPMTYPGQNVVNVLWLLTMVGLIIGLVTGDLNPVFFFVLAGMALLFGVMFVLPIGGADMPVVIAMLNAYSGLAAAATGFVLSNKVLIIAGALDGSSGLLLSLLMCRAMNRSLTNVLFGAVGGTTGGVTGGDELQGDPQSISAVEAAERLFDARRVIIVPGYGMAAAGAHFAIREMADVLKERGISVKYAIHPVAGRMPGHMNVLLADANVPYDDLVEMDEINPEFPNTDVALVMGANDICNPAARTAEGSPIYGMPILDVDLAAQVIVIKRSMSPGFAGIPNELFVAPNCAMLFGDGKQVAEQLIEALSL
jgi:NAD(P) transhydrogenase subunit beta